MSDKEDGMSAYGEDEPFIPPEDLDPYTRFEMTIGIIDKHSRRGIPLGDEVDQIFKAEQALKENDLERFDRSIRLALENFVDDEDLDDDIEWCRWLLITLQGFEDVPEGIMKVFYESEDLMDEGEHEKARLLINRLKRTAVDRLSGHWDALYHYIQDRYKTSKKELHRDTKRHVKRLISAADLLMTVDYHIYQRKALRHIRRADEILKNV